MDESEIQLAGLDKAMIALAAHVKASDVEAAIGQLRLEAETQDGDEREATLYAVDVLDAGLRRFDEFSSGVLIRP